MLSSSHKNEKAKIDYAPRKTIKPAYRELNIDGNVLGYTAKTNSEKK